MSFSANNKKNESNPFNIHPGTEPKNNRQKNQIFHKGYSPTNITNNPNQKLSLNPDTRSTKNTYTASLFNKDKDFSYNSHPIKDKSEEDLNQYFIPKKKKTSNPPTIINDKKISFQRQKDKSILEFPLFDDNMIFKDINSSYLQDADNDDGGESSDEKIYKGKKFLSQEIEQSIKELQKNLKNNQNKPLLSRRMQFYKDDNKE